MSKVNSRIKDCENCILVVLSAPGIGCHIFGVVQQLQARCGHRALTQRIFCSVKVIKVVVRILGMSLLNAQNPRDAWPQESNPK